MMSVFCDEGVFHTVADILMSESDTFANICDLLGGFHCAKVLLYCRGLRVANADFSSFRTLLLQVDARHAENCRGDCCSLL